MVSLSYDLDDSLRMIEKIQNMVDYLKLNHMIKHHDDSKYLSNLSIENARFEEINPKSNVRPNKFEFYFNPNSINYETIFLQFMQSYKHATQSNWSLEVDIYSVVKSIEDIYSSIHDSDIPLFPQILALGFPGALLDVFTKKNLIIHRAILKLIVQFASQSSSFLYNLYLTTTANYGRHPKASTIPIASSKCTIVELFLKSLFCDFVYSNSILTHLTLQGIYYLIAKFSSSSQRISSEILGYPNFLFQLEFMILNLSITSKNYDELLTDIFNIISVICSSKPSTIEISSIVKFTDTLTKKSSSSNILSFIYYSVYQLIYDKESMILLMINHHFLNKTAQSLLNVNSTTETIIYALLLSSTIYIYDNNFYDFPYDSVIRYASSKNDDIQYQAILFLGNMMACGTNFIHFLFQRNVIQALINIRETGSFQTQIELGFSISNCIKYGTISELSELINYCFIEYLVNLIETEEKEITITAIRALDILLQTFPQNLKMSPMEHFFGCNGPIVFENLLESEDNEISTLAENFIIKYK